MSSEECPACHGRRLKPTSLAVTVGGINIADFCDKSVNEELDFIEHGQGQHPGRDDRCAYF